MNTYTIKSWNGQDRDEEDSVEYTTVIDLPEEALKGYLAVARLILGDEWENITEIYKGDTKLDDVDLDDNYILSLDIYEEKIDHEHWRASIKQHLTKKYACCLEHEFLIDMQYDTLDFIDGVKLAEKLFNLDHVIAYNL